MKRVGIATLKAQMGRYLRFVRRGHTVIILNRGKPVAELRPLSVGKDGSIVRPPTSGVLGFATLTLPPPLKAKTDVLRFPRAERQRNRAR